MPSLTRRLAALEEIAGPLTADRLRARARELTDDEDLLAVVDALHALVANPNTRVIRWPEKDADAVREDIKRKLARIAQSQDGTSLA